MTLGGCGSVAFGLVLFGVGVCAFAGCGGEVGTGTSRTSDTGGGGGSAAGPSPSSGGGSGGSSAAMGGAIAFGGPQSVCALPKDAGPCDGAMQRYFFTPGAGCSAFTYGGCQGNENNFQSLEGCNNYCVRNQRCDCDGVVPSCRADRECIECPVDMTHAEGTRCTMIGLACGLTRDGATCTCSVGDAGVAEWHCVSRL